MTDIHGMITNVYTAPAGSELTVAAPIGSTTFTVADVSDFEETGGRLYLPSGPYQPLYTSADPVTGVITLSGATIIYNFNVGDEVLVYPGDAKVMWAMVQADDLSEGVRAMVPYGMRDRLDTGIRDEVDQEAVTITDDSGRWVVKAIDDQPVTITSTPFQTVSGLGAGAQGVRIEDDTSSGVIKFYGGVSGETPGYINPAIVSNQPVVAMSPSATPTFNTPPVLNLRAGSASIIPNMELTPANAWFICAGGNFQVYPSGRIDCGIISAIGDVGTSGRLQTTGFGSSSNAANVFMTAGGYLNLSTSLSKFKLKQKPISLEAVQGILNLTPKTWFDRGEVEENGGKTEGLRRIPGLIAEDVEKHAPELATYDAEGNLQGVAYDRVAALLIPIIREDRETIARQKDRIDGLEARLARLEASLTA